MNSIKHGIRSAVMVPLGIAALAAGGALATPTAVWATTTYSGEICMQRVFAGPDTPITSSNLLNCSANDIRIARALDVVDTDGKKIESCTRGQTIDIDATFEVVVTANARYDAAFFFRTDGGNNARGDGRDAVGACSVTGLSPDVAPGLNLDNDGVGDLNAGTHTVKVRFEGLTCEANAEGKLKLPTCTSWHSNASTVATADPNNVASVYSWKPETKSKCRCDDGFSLDISVEEPKIKVTKTASKNEISESGGDVTFTVKVENENTFESLTIGMMTDYVWNPGNPSAPTEAAGVLSGYNKLVDLYMASESCAAMIDASVSSPIPPGGNVSCEFVDSVAAGKAGTTYVNVVEVDGYNPASGKTVTGRDRASVPLFNLIPAPKLEKKAINVKGCKVEVEYSVDVSNNTDEPITVTGLVDDQFGNIAAPSTNPKLTATDCSIGSWGELPAKTGSKSCKFTAVIEQSGSCTIDHTNTVTASGVDDDGESFDDASDTASVKVRVTELN